MNLDTGQLTLAAQNFTDSIEYVRENPMRSGLTDLIRKLESRDGVPFQPFEHISSRIPACLGGDDSNLANLHFAHSLDNMLFMGQILNQVKNLPEGTRIKDVLVDEATKTIRLVY